MTTDFYAVAAYYVPMQASFSCGIIALWAFDGEPVLLVPGMTGGGTSSTVLRVSSTSLNVMGLKLSTNEKFEKCGLYVCTVVPYTLQVIVRTSYNENEMDEGQAV